MKTTHKKSIRTLGSMALLGLAMLLASSKAAMAQDIVQGQFTLTEPARLGNTVLPSGEYQFFVHTLARSGWAANSPVIVDVRGMSKGAPFASVIAVGSRQLTPPSENTMELHREGIDMNIKSMHLENIELVFRQATEKTKTEARTRGTEPAQVATARTGRG